MKPNSMPVRGAYLIALFLTMATSLFVSASDDIRAVASLSSAKPYEGQPVALTVTLYSTVPDIAYAAISSREEFEGFTILNAPIVDNGENRLKRVIENGRELYSAVIYRTMLMPSETGSETIPKLEFTVGVRRPTTVDHPFFGRIMSTVVDDIEVSTRPIKVKIQSLPKAASGYSGAIGDFSIEGSVPPGKIYSGEDAIVVYRISGSGYVDTSCVPSLAEYLPGGVAFKSETNESSVIVSGDQLLSEIEMVYTIRAEDAGEYEIPPIPLVYFNPMSKTYQTSTSKPLKIKVIKSELPSKPKIIHSI